MILRISKKERVKRKMFKNIANKENINVIYRADEDTRRAVDSLYVKKTSYWKAVVASALLCGVIGFGVGIWFGATHTYTNNSVQQAVAPAASPDSKSKSQQ